MSASDEHARPGPVDVAVAARDRQWRTLAASVAAAIVLGLAAVAMSFAMPTPAGPVAAAVTSYGDQRLPGSEAPAAHGPDLGTLGLLLIGTSSGKLAGQHVNAYAYRDANSRRIHLYLSDQSFAMPAEADQLTDDTGAWTVRHDQIVVLCAQTPHEVLVIGTDSDLVHAVAVTLDLA